MLNGIFLALIASGVLVASFRGTMPDVTNAAIEAAKTAINLVVILIGQMAMWLGFMRILRDAGLMQALARGLAPLMRRLFPEIPADHPAMSAMILNIAANMLGLGNAATPFGLKAMVELKSLNPRPGVATNSMALFLAINTSGVAVFPLGVIAMRASLGSENAGGIFLPSILATFCSTVVAVLVARALQNRPAFAPERYAVPDAPKEEGESIADGIVGLDEAEAVAGETSSASRWRTWALLAFTAALVVAMVRYVAYPPAGSDSFELLKEVGSSWLLSVLMAVIVMFGFSHRVKVYESFVKGAREGFDIAIMIIPFLVAILVSIAIFRSSGMMDLLIAGLNPITQVLGFPAEALPMALIRPLSGSGALGVMIETMETYGPDSFPGFLVSVMNGSTETTFYVLAVYLGSVQIRAARHTVIACLAADFTGIAMATFFSRLFF